MYMISSYVRRTNCIVERTDYNCLILYVRYNDHISKYNLPPGRMLTDDFHTNC